MIKTKAEKVVIVEVREPDTVTENDVKWGVEFQNEKSREENNRYEDAATMTEKWRKEFRLDLSMEAQAQLIARIVDLTVEELK